MNDSDLMALIPMHALDMDSARALKQACGTALAAARAEGRAAGLEEAVAALESEHSQLLGGYIADGVWRARAIVKALAATSDGAGKVEQEQWFTSKGETR